MKKYIILNVLFILVNGLWAQERSVTGIVSNEQGMVIPFCQVSVKNKQQGVYANNDGTFIVHAIEHKDTLVFSCVGYETSLLALSEQTPPLSIRLKQSMVKLDEVAITTSKKKTKTGQLYNKTKHEGNAFLGPGFETGLYFKPVTKGDSWLKEIFIYISPLGLPDTKFRVHVYADDSLKKLPGSDITDSNLIVYGGPKGAEWIKIDLSQKYIPVQQGIYITMEWVSGFGNNNEVQKFVGVAGNRAVNVRGKRTYRVKESVRKHAEENPILFKGQVLGMTRNRPGKLCYSRRVFEAKGWSASPDPIIPMIYATYIYYK